MKGGVGDVRSLVEVAGRDRNDATTPMISADVS